MKLGDSQALSHNGGLYQFLRNENFQVCMHQNSAMIIVLAFVKDSARVETLGH